MAFWRESVAGRSTVWALCWYPAVVAEWLRRLTRNQFPSGSVGSNPTDCGDKLLYPCPPNGGDESLNAWMWRISEEGSSLSFCLEFGWIGSQIRVPESSQFCGWTVGVIHSVLNNGYKLQARPSPEACFPALHPAPYDFARFTRMYFLPTPPNCCPTQHPPSSSIPTYTRPN